MPFSLSLDRLDSSIRKEAKKSILTSVDTGTHYFSLLFFFFEKKGEKKIERFDLALTDDPNNSNSNSNSTVGGRKCAWRNFEKANVKRSKDFLSTERTARSFHDGSTNDWKCLARVLPNDLYLPIWYSSQ